MIVNVDELMSVIRASDQFFYKAGLVALQQKDNKLQMNLLLSDSDLQIEYPVVSGSISDTICVKSDEFFRTLKIMNGETSFMVKNNSLVISSSGRKYVLALVDLETPFFNDFDYQLVSAIKNEDFLLLQKHLNLNAKDNCKNICFMAGDKSLWIATDRYNSVSFPAPQLCKDSFMFDGSYAKFVGSVKENFKIGLSNDNSMVFKNSNLQFVVSINKDLSNDIFPLQADAFSKNGWHCSSFDSQDVSKKYNNIKSVINGKDFLNGIKMVVAENGFLQVEAMSKAAEESVIFNNSHSPMDVVVDFDTLDKVLFCCNGNIVDMYRCSDSVDDTHGKHLFKIEYDHISQIFVSQWQLI